MLMFATIQCNNSFSITKSYFSYEPLNAKTECEKHVSSPRG